MVIVNLVAVVFRLDGRKGNTKIWIPSSRRYELVSHLPAIHFSCKKRDKLPLTSFLSAQFYKIYSQIFFFF